MTSALSDPSVDREAGALVARAIAPGAMQTVGLFGRDRVIDFSQFQPRGHYTGDRAPYFRAVMWLSRLELSGADPAIDRRSVTSTQSLDRTRTELAGVGAPGRPPAVSHRRRATLRAIVTAWSTGSASSP